MLPAEVETPADFVRVVLQAAVGEGVVQKEDTSEWDLASHRVTFHTDSQCSLDFLLLEVNIPRVTRTAGVLGRHTRFVASGYNLQGGKVRDRISPDSKHELSS